MSSYDYELDQALIAQEPTEPRHFAKLLIVEGPSEDLSASRHMNVWDLQEELLPGDLIILNNTRVLKARLKVRRAGGGVGELLLVEPTIKGTWLCLAKPAKRMRVGDSLFLDASDKKQIQLKVNGIDNHSGGRFVQFPEEYGTRETMEKFLEKYGEVPLPPYLEKSLEDSDSERYQTRYATSPGAVAAPTAGLHLSDELLLALRRKGIQLAFVTLHVGLGTFKTLDKEDLKGLKLHSEWVDVSEAVVQSVLKCRERGGRVIAVGTTSVRAVEAAFCKGEGCFKPWSGNVDLVIQPGYKFGVVDGLLTNFHLPRSSLLLLVSALIGRKKLLALYKLAMKREYRFYSYGDAMWIPPEAVLPKARK